MFDEIRASYIDNYFKFDLHVLIYLNIRFLVEKSLLEQIENKKEKKDILCKSKNFITQSNSIGLYY